jgi:type IV secretory pathway VirB4 component
VNNFHQKMLEQHIAVLGKTGSGKTCTAKLAVEQVVEVVEMTEADKKAGVASDGTVKVAADQ